MPANSSGRPGPSSRLSRREILEAARRFYDLGHTKGDIAKDMGISGSYLARVLQRARDNGWIKIFIEDDRETELAAALRQRYPNLVHVEVVPSGSTPEDTARSIAMATATWFDDLLDRDEESGNPQIRNVAIGGSMVHGQFVQRIASRKNGISVGPTALTPTSAKVARFTAPMLAQQLAFRLGAISPGDAMPPPAERTGFLYSPSRLVPPAGPIEAIAQWWADVVTDADYLEMLQFWERLDIAFVSMVGTQWVYDDVRRKLESLGIRLEHLVKKGATALLANQFIRDDGSAVPLVPGVPSYEPAIPVETLRRLSHRATATDPRSGFVVLDAWGERSGLRPAWLETSLCNVLCCDDVVGTSLR